MLVDWFMLLLVSFGGLFVLLIPWIVLYECYREGFPTDSGFGVLLCVMMAFVEVLFVLNWALGLPASKLM